MSKRTVSISCEDSSLEMLIEAEFYHETVEHDLSNGLGYNSYKKVCYHYDEIEVVFAGEPIAVIQRQDLSAKQVRQVDGHIEDYIKSNDNGADLVDDKYMFDNNFEQD
jgi:hypothetical protein